MKLIAGLGNPGLRYRNTRHNAGFLVIKEIAKRFRISIKKKKYKGIFAKGSIEGNRVILFMPQTYMNLSGEALRDVVKKERIEPENLLVICDDIDLLHGFTRLRQKGGSAGHNGLKSAIKCLGTDAFPRLRVGIGHERKPHNVSEFVLRPFDTAEKPLLKGIIKEAAECAVVWLGEGPDKAMTRFNKRQSSFAKGEARSR